MDIKGDYQIPQKILRAAKPSSSSSRQSRRPRCHTSMTGRISLREAKRLARSKVMKSLAGNAKRVLSNDGSIGAKSSNRIKALDELQSSDSRVSRPSKTSSAQEVGILVGFVFKNKAQHCDDRGVSGENQSTS